jgi:uncharacterized membrane protein YqhA
MVAAVISSVLLAVADFYMATLDALRLPHYLAIYSDPHLDDAARAEVRAKVLTSLIKALDGYIIAAILIIFPLGLFELFFGKLEVENDSEVAARLMRIGGLDGLKDRISKLVVLVLVIEFFQRALQLDYQHPLDLLYLALGILFIGAALYLSHFKTPGENGGH